MCHCREQYHNFKSMEKSASGTLLQNSGQQQRLALISQKLQNLAQRKQTQLKEDTQHYQLDRIAQLEIACANHIKDAESHLRLLRQTLATSQTQETETARKMQLAQQARRQQMSELHRIVARATTTENKERKDAEGRVATAWQSKAGKLQALQAEDKQNRIELCNSLENALAEQLPELHLHITAAQQQAFKKQQHVSQECLAASDSFFNCLHGAERDREANRRKANEWLAHATGELNEEIQKERKDREESKQKLLTLWEAATSKIKA